MLTGEVCDAAAAAAGGLVDLSVPDDEVDAAVEGQVRALAAGSPWALAETKRLLRSGGLRGSVDDLLDLSARAFAGEEGQEGIAAFREKRPARWVPAAD
jgi:methylglutaconyl-CoA hydratase